MADLSLPTDDELSGLRWPLLDVARMLHMARLVLALGGIADDEASAIAEHLQRAGGPELKGLADCDELAREFNGLRSELGVDGWTVPAMPPGRFRVQSHHVAAVAALLIGRRLLSLQPGLSRLALALPAAPGAPVGDRLADLTLASLAGRCCSLAADAVFMVGRSEMRQAVEEAEAKRRSAAASKGGAQRRFADEDLLAFLAEWQSTHNHQRGRIKAASRHFDVTDKAIQRRMRIIAKKQEATG